MKTKLEGSLAYALVLEFFEWDSAKAQTWFATNNPLLGDVSPNFLLENGREAKLLKFITNQLEGNAP